MTLALPLPPVILTSMEYSPSFRSTDTAFPLSAGAPDGDPAEEAETEDRLSPVSAGTSEESSLSVAVLSEEEPETPSEEETAAPEEEPAVSEVSRLALARSLAASSLSVS